MTSVSTTPDTPTAAPSRRWQRAMRIAAPLVSLAIVALVFWYFLPQFTSISAVWASIRSMSSWQLGLLALAALWNLATYWFVMVSTMPGLTYGQAAVVTESSTAVSNTLPGGGALGIAMSYTMYSSWGFSRSRSSVSLLVAGVWNNFAKLAMPVLALALLAFTGGGGGGGRIIAGAFGIAGLVGAVTVFTLLLRSKESARRIGLGAARVASTLLRTLRRPPVHGWELATMKFRDRTTLLLRARWIRITFTTLVSHLSLFLVLLLALRPFLARCAEALTQRTDLSMWTHGHCPFCGWEPDFAVITPTADRRLICGRCLGQWIFPSLACPFCSNDERSLITSFATRDGRYRVYACDVCRRYLKAYDGRHAARPVIVAVDSIATLPLDAAAMQRGYVG